MKFLMDDGRSEEPTRANLVSSSLLLYLSVAGEDMVEEARERER